MKHGKCTLSKYERSLFCAQKRVSGRCQEMKVLGRRCWYLEYGKDEVMMEAKRGVNKIVAFSGFSEDAVDYAERYRPRLRLLHRDIVVKPRRRVAPTPGR